MKIPSSHRINGTTGFLTSGMPTIASQLNSLLLSSPDKSWQSASIPGNTNHCLVEEQVLVSCLHNSNGPEYERQSDFVLLVRPPKDRVKGNAKHKSIHSHHPSLKINNLAYQVEQTFLKPHGSGDCCIIT